MVPVHLSLFHGMDVLALRRCWSVQFYRDRIWPSGHKSQKSNRSRHLSLGVISGHLVVLGLFGVVKLWAGNVVGLRFGPWAWGGGLWHLCTSALLLPLFAGFDIGYGQQAGHLEGTGHVHPADGWLWSGVNWFLLVAAVKILWSWTCTVYLMTCNVQGPYDYFFLLFCCTIVRKPNQRFCSFLLQLQ